MKKEYYPSENKNFSWLLLGFSLLVGIYNSNAQTCPTAVTGSISAFPNTYYPGESSPSAGANSIILGAVPTGYGSTAISPGDILLVIQMQGAQITANNNNSYGDGVSGGFGNGYLSNANLLAGKLEYVIATNAVPLTGGTLNISTGLANSYKRALYGTDGQYRYQVIRVPFYSNLTLSATITAPSWNDSLGGVIVLDANNTLNFNGQTINVSGVGFRGGGGRSLGGGTGAYTDYYTLATDNTNGSKGEGIAGTPRYLNNGGTTIFDNTSEGYPNGSYAQGAPGNAGGGGTDGNPSGNTDNSGGGGGGNGGAGGKGGNSWSSDYADGGEPAANFSQVSPSRLVMGGGGGSGTNNNSTGTPGSGFASSGAAGGGIVIISALAVSGTGTINANGGAANNTVANDGSGGGGAGGSVLIFSGSALSNITVTANGGSGGTNTPGSGVTAHGPGGGGGGGAVYSNYTLNASSSASGGANGTTTGGSNYGSASGSTGILTQNITQSQISSTSLICTILPVNFLSVSAVENSGYVNVIWDVADETEMPDYVVEKSTDGSSFYAIATVVYQQNSGNQNTYAYKDYQIVSSPIIYYRIKQTSASGTFSFSNIVFVKLILVNVGYFISPNPANQSTVLSFTSNTTMDMVIRLFDMNGNVAIQKQYLSKNGVNSVKLENLQSLPMGLYVVQWFNGINYETARVIIRH